MGSLFHPYWPERSSKSTVTNVDAAQEDTKLLDIKLARVMVIIFNDSPGNLYMKYGSGASPNSFTVKIPGRGYWEMPLKVYTGEIYGFWDITEGAARITELG